LNAQAAQHYFGQHQAAFQTNEGQQQVAPGVVHVRPDPAPSDFGWALVALRLGHRVCRSGWNGKGMWLELQRPDARSKMTLPYFFMSTADGNLVPWLASQTDLLASGWQLVPYRLAFLRDDARQ
jgi:hypothetical protein